MPLLSDEVTKEIHDWCTEEVRRQGDPPNYIPRMIQAWQYGILICNEWRCIDETDVHILGGLVKGIEGNTGPYQKYRQTPVSFANGTLALAPDLIERQMWLLFLNQGVFNVEQWTKAFLDIHPFEDGNGRVASIMYNIKKGTILHPIHKPDYYGGEHG
jgi:hypothetical protein